MEVGIQEPVGTPARAPHAIGRHGVIALALLSVASVILSVLGIGTGDGPLGPPPGYGVGISRDVGSEVTEGGTFLENDSWFTAHLERIRPIAVGTEATGLGTTAVEVVPASPSGIGIVDGAGYEHIAKEVRSDPAGYAVLPERRMGQDTGYVEVLVRVKVTRPGAWHYRGYEVTYRSGLVRHHLVVPADLWVCTPSGALCPPGRD